jgi:hypothetical protein
MEDNPALVYLSARGPKLDGAKFDDLAVPDMKMVISMGMTFLWKCKWTGQITAIKGNRLMPAG